MKLPHDADFLEAIKHENYLIVIKMWNETQKSYVKEIKEGLVKLDTHRELIASRLADVQFRFLSVVQRPDDKQVRNGFSEVNQEIYLFFFVAA